MMLQEKVPVINPLKFRNTVGAELADILEAKGIDDAESVVGLQNIRGRERLSKRTLKKVQSLFDDSDLIEYLTQFQQAYEKDKPEYVLSYKKDKETYSKVKSVLPLLRGEFTDGCDLLDDVLDFLGVETCDQIDQITKKQVALFRTQKKLSVDPINLYAWLRRGKLDFDRLNLPEYDEKKLKDWIECRYWKNQVENADYFLKLPDVFAKFGVGLVFVPSLPKVVYGAVRWFDGRPLIQISDRGSDLVTCWVTLFHELGHVILHKNEEIYEGLTKESKTEQLKREKDANSFASFYLFNGDKLRQAVFERKRSGQIMSANALAEEFDVPPIFASYWLLKAQYAPAFQRRIHIDFTSQYQ